MRHLVLPLVLVTACAAPRRVTFAEAMAEGRARRKPPAPTALTRALDRFVAALQPARAAAGGAAMPPGHAAAWGEVLDAVEPALPAASALELARVRLVLQAELDADTGAFGDVPPALAERLVGTLRRVSTRLVALTTVERPAVPAAFQWPTRPVVLTSPWGAREHPIHGGQRFHAGVDLAGEPAQEVRAAEAGTVVFAGWNGGHGKQLEVAHDAHLSTRYSHLMTWLKEPGQRVRRGEVIGLVGETGAVTGPHLHFELRRDGEPLDPERELPPPPGGRLLAGRVLE